MMDGHGVPCEEYILAHTKVITKDPCPKGLGSKIPESIAPAPGLVEAARPEA